MHTAACSCYNDHIKKYYSPVKEYDTFKRPHPFFKLLRLFVGWFFPKNEFIWKTEKPSDGEPLFFVCNHTKIYAPTYFIVNKEQRARVWANYYFLYFKVFWHHMKTKVINNRKPKFIIYPLAFLLTPVIILTFRAFEPVPVFHKDERVETMTFKKSIETMKAGVPQIIFPERTENKVNRYIFQFNHGFPKVAERYYQETGKILRFFPVYCAEKLRTFVVGDPIAYDPNVSMDTQADDICHYLENKIKELGDSLPEHEPVIYG